MNSGFCWSRVKLGKALAHEHGVKSGKQNMDAFRLAKRGLNVSLSLLLLWLLLLLLLLLFQSSRPLSCSLFTHFGGSVHSRDCGGMRGCNVLMSVCAGLDWKQVDVRLRTGAPVPHGAALECYSLGSDLFWRTWMRCDCKPATLAGSLRNVS